MARRSLDEISKRSTFLVSEFVIIVQKANEDLIARLEKLGQR